MIGVTGANGHLGQIVIAKLKETQPSDQIVALARSPEKTESLELGVEVRAFDYNNPDTILAGLDGIDTLMLISGSEVGQRELQHRNVILGAANEGVGRIVYTSILRAKSSPLQLAQEHVATEMMLADTGLPYTILRNGWYLENYIDTAKSAIAAGTLYGAAGDGRISAAARQDFGEAAAAVLTGTGHDNKIYELSGDAAFTLSDLASVISDITGTEIPYHDMPEADYAALLTQAGVPAPWPEFLAHVDTNIAAGALYDEGTTLSGLIGRPTTTLRDVLTEALAPGA